MKSGLEGRNNELICEETTLRQEAVSMKSGLEGRNNPRKDVCGSGPAPHARLNEVRPRRPEQWLASKGRLD